MFKWKSVYWRLLAVGLVSILFGIVVLVYVAVGANSCGFSVDSCKRTFWHMLGFGLSWEEQRWRSAAAWRGWRCHYGRVCVS